MSAARLWQIYWYVPHRNPGKEHLRYDGQKKTLCGKKVPRNADEIHMELASNAIGGPLCVTCNAIHWSVSKAKEKTR